MTICRSARMSCCGRPCRTLFSRRLRMSAVRQRSHISLRRGPCTRHWAGLCRRCSRGSAPRFWKAEIVRALNKYEMEFLDVFRGRDFLRRKAVASVQGVEVFDRVRDQIGASWNRCGLRLNAVDPTLARSAG